MTRAHFCRAVMMWGGSLRERVLIFWLACLEVAVSLRVMRPTSSDARLNGGRVKVAFSVYVIDASYCGSVHVWEYRVVRGRFGCFLVLH